METKDYLTNYYERYDEEGRLISKHGMVEYITTMKYIEKYLKPNMRVLEIGAATGRYSHALAQKGYRVDAVELVKHNIEIFKQNTIAGEPVTITQGNAMDLSDFESDTYDITLLLGPMYHLFTTEDKLKALSEAIRVTKKDGIVFAAYCMGVTQLHFIAADGYTNHMRETVDQMDDRMYELYLKYHLAICERQDMVGYSHHTLDIFRKE